MRDKLFPGNMQKTLRKTGFESAFFFLTEMPQRQEIKITGDFNFLGSGENSIEIQTELHKFPLIDVICTCLKC